ncbi:MAG: hypothetical protein BRD50_03595 [Bacteroidetes bacterium SW_11_45_7]|nr:MAG: hypothetical protein BRD50_03595 [Bacteroidetes bacterium SW_11_45_7]
MRGLSKRLFDVDFKGMAKAALSIALLEAETPVMGGFWRFILIRSGPLFACQHYPGSAKMCICRGFFGTTCSFSKSLPILFG